MVLQIGCIHTHLRSGTLLASSLTLGPDLLYRIQDRTSVDLHLFYRNYGQDCLVPQYDCIKESISSISNLAFQIGTLA